MPAREVKKVPPDGGWGWFIVIGSCLINMSTRAVEPAFGLLFGDLFRQLGVETTGASILMSIEDAIVNFSGLFVGPLVKKFSYRKVAIVGGILSVTALMLTAFAESFVHLLTTFSLLGGFGFGLATACTLIGMNSYFGRRKGQAVGLAMAGTAFGFMATPQIVSYLLNEYGFRSAMLIYSALSLHCIAGALLFQPVKWHLKTVYPDEEKLLTVEGKPGVTEETGPEGKIILQERRHSLRGTISDPMRKKFSRQSSGPISIGKIQSGSKHPTFPSSPILTKRRKSAFSHVSLVDLTGSSTHIGFMSHMEEEEDDLGLEMNPLGVQKKNQIKKKEPGVWDKISTLFDLKLLKDGVYLNILFGTSIIMVAEMCFKLIFPFFLADLGFTKREIAFALSLMAIADLAARLIVPPILDRITVPKRITLIFGSVLIAICRSCLAEQTDRTYLIAILLVHGFLRGMTLIHQPLILSEYATGDNFPAVLGLSMVSKGLFIVAIGPLCGYIRDVSGSYPLYIHFQSVMILIMVIAWSIEYIMREIRKEKKTITPVPTN